MAVASHWLTITEIARRVGRPPSTVTYWRNTFRDQLEERTNRAGHATYRLDVFEEIGRLLREQAGRAEIRRTLAERRGTAPAASRSGFERELLDRLDRIAAAVERIAERLDGERNE